MQSSENEVINTRGCPNKKQKDVLMKREVVKFDDISLNVVLYNRAYSRNKGTISQIIRSLVDMSERLLKPDNEYQTKLYPHIINECKSIVDKYNELLHTINPIDNRLFGYYLNGPLNNGKRKGTTTRHEYKSYGVSEFKETLKSIDDRLRHIKKDCNVKKRDATITDNETFNRIVEFCDAYHLFINDKLKGWDEFIRTIRSENGNPNPHRSLK